jgi:hypothetical protein
MGIHFRIQVSGVRNPADRAGAGLYRQYSSSEERLALWPEYGALTILVRISRGARHWESSEKQI